MNPIHGGDIYRNPDVIDFSSNMNPLGTPASVIRAAQESIRQIRNYPDCDCSALRSTFSQREHLPENQIFFGNGAAEVIHSLVLAVKPKKTLLPAPTFSDYEQALQSVDCDVIYHRLERKDGFALTDKICEQITDDIDMLFICNPNNPTGTIAEKRTLLAILAACEQHHSRLVVDECFMDFVKNADQDSMRDQLADHPALLVLGAFTKSYAMAGLRLGYGLCSDTKLLGKMRDVTQPWNVSIPAQAGGIAALGEEDYVRRGRDIVTQERTWMMEQLTKAGYTLCDSSANYIFFHSQVKLYESALQAGFLIRDCSNYPGLQQGDYRIAVRMHEENERIIQWLTQS